MLMSRPLAVLELSRLRAKSRLFSRAGIKCGEDSWSRHTSIVKKLSMPSNEGNFITPAYLSVIQLFGHLSRQNYWTKIIKTLSQPRRVALCSKQVKITELFNHLLEPVYYLAERRLILYVC